MLGTKMTSQQWLSLPLEFIPTEKETFPIRLKNCLLNFLSDECRRQGRLVQVGDVLLIDAGNIRAPNFGKVSAAQLREWQNNWRQEFGEDFEKELKIWEAS